MEKTYYAEFDNISSVFAVIAFLLILISGCKNAEKARVFNVMDFGAKGDSLTLDTEAIQKAIDKASEQGNQSMVLFPSDHKYLISTLVLKSNIDFHLEGNAELQVSSRKEDYSGEAAIVADGANNITISGTGSINGRALEFMDHYEAENEWWIPKEWRPKIFILTNCTNLVIREITISKAPIWSLHMLGCENVLIDHINIFNNLDVPNCDGVDPDHCRNVEIRYCTIECGDDAIVVKATKQNNDYGPSANIWVHDCTLKTQDSGLKIGTETTDDIFNIVFERCEIKSSCRGLTIQLRDKGNVSNITFKDIDFTSRYHSDPWWGRGEAISFTAIPRVPDSEIGIIQNILVENVTGVAENSIRVNGTKESRIHNVQFNNVHVKLDRWTDYPGNLFDNRPTKTYPDIETHQTPGFYIRFADQIKITNSSISWGENCPDYFTHALEAHNVSGLNTHGFKGEAANPQKYNAIKIK